MITNLNFRDPHIEATDISISQHVNDVERFSAEKRNPMMKLEKGFRCSREA